MRDLCGILAFAAVFAAPGLGFYISEQKAHALVDMWREFDASTVCEEGGAAGEGACVWPDPRYTCSDTDNRCSYWAELGECMENPRYMLMSCARSCGSCFLKDKNYRCQRNETAHRPAISEKGEVNAMFEDVTTSETWKKYSPKIHSRDPWVVTFESFMSPEEVDDFLSQHMNFKRSVDAGALQPDGSFAEIRSMGRTSSSFWCTDQCWERPIMTKIAERISEITRIPVDNGEYPQVLRYDKEQEYTQHHDYIPGHLDLPIGPRLYTFFVYLSDVEDGGETHFPLVNDLKVKPKKGKAVLWPSVLDRNPLMKDRRTKHAALPVKKGRKYAMNIWLHMYNFHDYFEIGCTG